MMENLKTIGTKLRWAESNWKLPQMNILVCFQQSVHFQCILLICNSLVPCVVSVWESLWNQPSIFLSYFTAKQSPDMGFGSWAHDHVDLGQFTQAFRVSLPRVWKEGVEPEIHYDQFQLLMSIILWNEKGIKYA